MLWAHEREERLKEDGGLAKGLGERAPLNGKLPS